MAKPAYGNSGSQGGNSGPTGGNSAVGSAPKRKSAPAIRKHVGLQ